MASVLVLGAALALYSALPAHAEGAPQPRVIHAVDNYPYALWRESWVGGDVLANSWSIYSGSTFALTGDIERPGWRLRTIGGYGRYTYRKWIRGLDGPERPKFTGHKVFSDALLGYHFQWHRLTLKAFAGMTSERHIIDPRDPDNPVSDSAYGGKAALEAWLTVSDKQWLAGNISAASAFNTYKLGLRTGYAVLEALDLGLEARFEGNRAYNAGRIGGFATWRLDDAGLTVAVGATGDRDMRPSHYGRINLFVRY